MTPTEAFEAGRARNTDTTVLRGVLLSNVGAGTTPSALIVFNPSSAANFGTRAAALSAVFSRYRFKSIRVRFLGTTTATGTQAFQSLGVQDDVSITSQNPTTASGVAELRCSGVTLGDQTVPTEFIWTPVDKNLWYYTTNDLTEARLSTSGILWGASSGTSGSISLQLDYTIVFQGAIDTGSF
jgi:hypothetical protein